MGGDAVNHAGRRSNVTMLCAFIPGDAPYGEASFLPCCFYQCGLRSLLCICIMCVISVTCNRQAICAVD